MSQSLRVLAISHLYPRPENPVSGLESYRRNLALKAAGCEIIVVVPVPLVPPLVPTNALRNGYRQVPLKRELDGLEIFHPRYAKIPGLWWNGVSTYTMYLSLRSGLNRLIQEFRPDVIHSQAATPAGYVGLKLARINEIPIISSVIGSDIHKYPFHGPMSMRLTLQVMRFANKLVANCEDMRQDVLSLVNTDVDVEIISHGCDAEHFTFDGRQRVAIREQLRIDEEEPVFVFSGAVMRAKGIFELLEGFSRVTKDRHIAHLVLVGKIVDDADVRRFIIENGLTGRVHLVGQKSPDAMPAWLSVGDIMVFPSHAESLPSAVMEAMSCSRPIVATNIGGIPEMVTEGETGLLVNPKDADALTKAMLEMLQRRDEWPEMGRKAREAVVSRFSWAATAERYMALYRECLGQGV